jgi:hypothetical protein
MATDLHTAPEPHVTRLITGIISDIQELLQQQLALFRHEVQADFQRTRQAALVMAVGAGLGLLGLGLLFFMLVYLLHEAAGLPLWGSFGLVGGGLLIAGGILLMVGRTQFSAFNPLPDESAQALKENIQCLTDPHHCRTTPR